MKQMLQRVASVVAGLVAGSCVNMAFVLLNVKILYPTDVSFDDTQAFANYIATLPYPAFLVVWLAHLGQTIVGGYVAARLSSSSSSSSSDETEVSTSQSSTAVAVPVYAVATLTMMGTVMNQLSLPAPLWTWLEVPLHLVFARYIVLRQHQKQRPDDGSRKTS